MAAFHGNLLEPFSDEQARVAANLEVAYRARRDARRSAADLGPTLTWRRRGEVDYLYTADSVGGGSSLGRRSPETEERFASYRAERERSLDLERGAAAQLEVQVRLYRALRLLQIGARAAAILRVLDERRMLDRSLMVIGTNTMAAYELEAGARFAMGVDTTEDFDLAWAGEPVMLVLSGGQSVEGTLFAALKLVDDTYTVNTERPFQARNRDAYEVELLAAPSQMRNLPRDEKLSPIGNLMEQEWLLRGRRIDQVVGALDGTAARIVAPDPRWMALHKIWLSRQDKRSTLKRGKDERQGHMLLAAVIHRMPHFPIDEEFRQELPAELVPLLDPALAWVQEKLLAAKTTTTPAPRRRTKT